ncbi:MAG TPA: pitrilysin family protein [Xanthobacteraceae bacterium]|nr:pitrilysin family protein [Xanthobacteraceae bacterium]
MTRFLAALAAAATIAFASAASAESKIEPVVSPGGIKAWLVRDSAVPMVAIDFAFAGGADADPADKPGVGNMLGALLDEGAGDLDSRAFQEQLEEKAIELGFNVGRDQFRGSLHTLSENLGEAVDLLHLALTVPRFDNEPVERIRSQLLANLSRASTSPSDIANKRWWAVAFPGHPYGRPSDGTPESVAAVTVDDLRAYMHNVFARDTLIVGIVGDIDAQAAGKLLDRLFGDLPAKGTLVPVPQVAMKGLGERVVVNLDVPQTVINFGAPGVARADPDFITAYIVNHIYGGGSFTSRLYREVREKRGLAYGVHTSLFWMTYSDEVVGGTATRADKAGETLSILETERERMASEGPTQQELDEAKAFLKGSYALSFDTSAKIAGQLVQLQIDKLGIDYPERRNALIDAVTLADAKRVAKRLLDGKPLTVVVGRAQGLNKTN